MFIRAFIIVMAIANAGAAESCCGGACYFQDQGQEEEACYAKYYSDNGCTFTYSQYYYDQDDLNCQGLNFGCPQNVDPHYCNTDKKTKGDDKIRLATGWVILITTLSFILCVIIMFFVFKKYKRKQYEAEVKWRNTYNIDSGIQADDNSIDTASTNNNNNNNTNTKAEQNNEKIKSNGRYTIVSSGEDASDLSSSKDLLLKPAIMLGVPTKY